MCQDSCRAWTCRIAGPTEIVKSLGDNKSRTKAERVSLNGRVCWCECSSARVAGLWKLVKETSATVMWLEKGDYH